MSEDKTKHWSDCAVNNGPALPVGSCDCGGMSDDIVKLCRWYAAHEGDTSYGATFEDAAAEIERLRAALAARQKGHFDGERIVSDAEANAVAAEREACARIADEHKGSATRKRKRKRDGRPLGFMHEEAMIEVAAEERGEDIAAEIIAAAIRARCKPDPNV